MPTKFQDDWFINSWEILTFRPLEKEKKKLKLNKNFRKFESFQVDDYILCWASPGCCCRGSPSGWREMSHLQNLKIIEKWEMLTKNYDDWSISGWEIEKRRFHHNIPCAPSPWCCSWGSSDGRNEFFFISIYQYLSLWNYGRWSITYLMMYSIEQTEDG